MVATAQAPLLINTRTAAQMLNLSEKTVLRLANSRQIPCVRVGSAMRYSVDALKEWIDQQGRVASGQPEATHVMEVV